MKLTKKVYYRNELVFDPASIMIGNEDLSHEDSPINYDAVEDAPEKGKSIMVKIKYKRPAGIEKLFKRLNEHIKTLREKYQPLFAQGGVVPSIPLGDLHEHGTPELISMSAPTERLNETLKQLEINPDDELFTDYPEDFPIQYEQMLKEEGAKKNA